MPSPWIPLAPPKFTVKRLGGGLSRDHPEYRPIQQARLPSGPRLPLFMVSGKCQPDKEKIVQTFLEACPETIISTHPAVRRLLQGRRATENSSDDNGISFERVGTSTDGDGHMTESSRRILLATSAKL